MSASAVRPVRQATYPPITAWKSHSPDLPSPFPTFEDDHRPLEGLSLRERSHSHRMSRPASWGSQRPHNPWDGTLDANTTDSPVLHGNDAAKARVFAPMHPSLTFAMPTSYERMSAAFEDDVASDYSGIHGNGSEWSDYEDEDEPMVDTYHTATIAIDGPDLPQYVSPLVDDMSPIDNAEPGSSPGPMTPFGDYVDRAVVYPAQNAARHSDLPLYEGQGCGPDCTRCQPQQNVPHVEKPVPIATPSATDVYRKTADYLSVWVSEYIWKLCVTMPDRSGLSPAHPSTPPASLATSVRSLLLSTILQPSAIFLALKYISRLPVFLGPMYLPYGCDAEAKFRAALLGSPEAYNREDMESQAPFRLIVLGFMFANKWLDDHTFSNKTWHSISGIPIRWLNNLESCALTVFKYDLTISVHEWADWLSHLSSYHTSLLSGHHPQPVGRLASSPCNVVRKHIDDLIVLNETAVLGDGQQTWYRRPVFTGLEERQREREEQYVVQDIDLDEGGPLRDEYMPKRRSTASTREDQKSGAFTRPRPLSFSFDHVAVDRRVPPTRWSPQLDRPVNLSHPSSLSAAAPRGFFVAAPSAITFHPQVAPAVAHRWPAASGYASDPSYGYMAQDYVSRSGGGSTYAVPVFSPQHSIWPGMSYLSHAPGEPSRVGYAPIVRCGA